MFWFSIGALFAMVASFFIDNVVIQTAIFLICSTILLFATRSFVSKFQKKDPDYKTNSSSIEGKIGKVTKEIDSIEGKGQVKVNGEVWSAKSFDGTSIPEGTDVTIKKIEGVKAIVETIK